MIKRLASDVRIEQVRHASEIALEVSFAPGAMRDWSLGLVLLKEQLVDALLVTESPGRSSLELCRSGQTRDRAKAVFAGSATRLALSNTELDHLVHFFLKYFRDGIAEVDHVDVQAVSGEADQECYITFIVPESAPPVSSAEARKRLGLT
jgi:hypothetical protein